MALLRTVSIQQTSMEVMVRLRQDGKMLRSGVHLLFHQGCRYYPADAPRARRRLRAVHQHSATTIHARQLMDSSRRKKSCRECAKAKRKCSLGSPCQRCSKQGWPCTYLDSPSRAHDQIDAHERSADSNPFHTVEDFNYDISTVGTKPLNDVEVGGDTSGLLDLAPLAPFAPMTSSKLSFSSTLKSHQLARVEYPCRVLMAAPASFVYENQTPWSHVLLWEDEMPKCLRGKWCSGDEKP